MSFLKQFKDKLTHGRSTPPALPAQQPLDNGAAYLDRADALLNEGKPEAAVADYSRAIELLTGLREEFRAFYNRALAYRAMGDHAAATADWGQAIRLAPTHALSYLNRGNELQAQEQYAAAVEDYSRALALFAGQTDKAATYSNLASAESGLGEWRLALDDCNRASLIAPGFAEHNRELALKNLGSTPQPELTQAERVRLAREHEHAGWACRSSGDPVTSLAHFNRALDYAPEVADLYYDRGVANSILHRYAEAMADLNRALQLEPRHHGALAERGLTLLEVGNLQAALSDCDAAVALEPAYVVAHRNRGAVLAKLERWREALTCMDLALRLAPDNPDLYFDCSQLLMQLKRYREAYGYLSHLLQFFPGYPRAGHVRENMARIESLTGRVSPRPETTEAVLAERGIKYIWVTPDDTVAATIRRIREGGAYEVVLAFPEARFGVTSIYGRYGLRDRWTEIGDAIGEAILSLKLAQILDQWYPHSPGLPTDPEAAPWELAGPEILLTRDNEVQGVLRHCDDYYKAAAPLDLFGEVPLFERHGRSVGPQGSRCCAACGQIFAYYRPIMSGGALTDYACPHCGASPLTAWVEERMQPEQWSQAGFLAPGESLSQVIASDSACLQALGTTHAQLAERLEAILEAATAAYVAEVAAARASSNHELVHSGARGHAGLYLLPLAYPVADVARGLDQGMLPPATAGACWENVQVFLDVYSGFQYCPWTVMRRPWCHWPPQPPSIVTMVDGQPVSHPNPDISLPCRRPVTYRYADRDFLILNRNTGAYLRGPGLIAHLIREHHFFEGPQTPYRVDPERAVRVLGPF